eukprot:14245797-Alexandrium_andersonii.AAC.1
MRRPRTHDGDVAEVTSRGDRFRDGIGELRIDDRGRNAKIIGESELHGPGCNGKVAGVRSSECSND